MNLQRNMGVRMVARHLRTATTGMALFLVCAIFPGSVFAMPDSSREGARLVPLNRSGTMGEDRTVRRLLPRNAIEACSGRQEGDPCSIQTPRGLLKGICLPGAENVFACRPRQEAQQQEAAPPPASRPPAATAPISPPEQKTEFGGVPASSAGNQPPMASETSRQAEPAAGSQPTAPAVSKEKEPAAVPAQLAPAVSTAPPLTAFFDMVGRYAGSWGSYLAVALFAAGLTWYGFYRHATKPLRRLRTVTRQLAGGDLSARVGEGLVMDKSEVAELGRDVDRMAERIENLVGAHQRLIRDVSHELRSPLARLNVALELARQSAGPGHAAPFERIERESDRLNELIGQLLMLTKLENDSAAVKMASLDVAALIAEIVQDVDFEARGNDRRVVAMVGGPLLMNGNRELLRQAVENLVRNAVRYTAPGTAVEISLRRRESAGRAWAHIEVRDQGPGVPESELYDIFRPFYRVNDSRERQSGGTGVGLAISDRAVRLHGGSLRAFNAPGVGLIMEMELPLAEVPQS